MTKLLVNAINSVSKKPIIGGIILAAIIGVVFVGAQINPDNPENEKSLNSEVWSTRIVGSEISSGGGVGVMTHLAGDTHTYSTIELERNVPYKFGFVPMGSSSNWIKISLSCNDLYPLNDAADCDVNFGGNVGGYWNFRILHVGLYWKQKL